MGFYFGFLSYKERKSELEIRNLCSKLNSPSGVL